VKVEGDKVPGSKNPIDSSLRKNIQPTYGGKPESQLRIYPV
jgi:hypothetical protein